MSIMIYFWISISIPLNVNINFRKTTFVHMFIIHIIQKTSIYRANLNALLTINIHEHLSYLIILYQKKKKWYL